MVLKGFITLLLLSFSNILIGQTSGKKSFQIIVSVENLKTPAKLILTMREVGQWVEYTTESKAGQFMLSGTIKEPSFGWLVMKYGNETDRSSRLWNILPLFIENTSLKINAKDSLSLASVKGSVLQTELEALTESMKDWEHKRTIAKEKEENRAAFDLEKKELIARFIDEHPESFVSLYALQNYSWDGSFTIDAESVAPLFERLTPQLRNTLSGKELNRDIQIARRTAMGSQAPDFTQRDTLDHPVSLSDFRGQYVLIDFWASWCKPCRVENPALVQVYKNYKDRNFTIVGVSLDNNKNNWIKAIRKDHLTWTHVSDLKFWKNEVALLFGVKTVPQNCLVDPTGKIIGRNIRIQELPTRLNERIR